MASPILHRAMWGKQDIDWSIDSVWTWILHTSFDALQHCLNQLEAPTMERVPHGDVPFLGTAESIRHELFLQ